MRKWLIGTGVALAGIGMGFSVGQTSTSNSVPKPPDAGFSRQSSANQGSHDDEAEHALLSLAKQAREQAGVSDLSLDESLSQAARTHSRKMAAQHALSHQFPGEADLQQRLAKDSNLQMDHVGENVGYAETTDDAHAGLMASPPHRKNLLDSSYNVVGIGVVRSNDMLYVTEDFGHSLPSYSEDQAQDAAAKAVAQARRRAGLSGLKQVQTGAAKEAACGMAKADNLRGAILPAKHIIRYTANSPSDLPDGMEKVLNDPAVGSFSVGVCYGRTSTYPNGIYWVFLVLN